MNRLGVRFVHEVGEGGAADVWGRVGSETGERGEGAAWRLGHLPNWACARREGNTGPRGSESRPNGPFDWAAGKRVSEPGEWAVLSLRTRRREKGEKKREREKGVFSFYFKILF